MEPKDIAQLVIQMRPPRYVYGKYAKIMWMLEEAAKLGMATALAPLLESIVTKNDSWK